MDNHDELVAKRNAKTFPHLKQYAPVWIIDEEIIEESGTVLFHAVFRHNAFGWISRRYCYDGFNDLLYQRGQTAIDEATVAEVETKTPFVQVLGT